MTDDELLAKAMRAVNDEKFRALWEGRWQELDYPSQSEADLAFMGMCWPSGPARTRHA